MRWGAGWVETGRESGDWQEEDGSMKKEILSLSCFGSVPHLSMENLFSLLKKKKSKKLQQLEVMSKGCVAFLFALLSCRTEQFDLSFPSLPVACGACSA